MRCKAGGGSIEPPPAHGSLPKAEEMNRLGTAGKGRTIG